ncbi:MAG: hypothetical protein LBO72_09605 [Helicobacteraceae bacterium]|jgi:hypothetical protein|nr:hypothetical protein [Helicobacteraceae bacterium]
MATRRVWQFRLFLIGALISCGLSAFAIYTIAFITAEISWALAALTIGACALPAILLGLPYLNGKFYFSYTRQHGLKFGEERRSRKRKSATKEHCDHAEWIDDE